MSIRKHKRRFVKILRQRLKFAQLTKTVPKTIGHRKISWERLGRSTAMGRAWERFARARMNQWRKQCPSASTDARSSGSVNKPARTIASLAPRARRRLSAEDYSEPMRATPAP